MHHAGGSLTSLITHSSFDNTCTRHLIDIIGADLTPDEVQALLYDTNCMGRMALHCIILYRNHLSYAFDPIYVYGYLLMTSPLPLLQHDCFNRTPLDYAHDPD